MCRGIARGKIIFVAGAHKHCKKLIKDEYGAMEDLAGFIQSEIVSKTELNQALSERIGTWKKALLHLESYANKQRSGILNRMTEMGLVVKKYRGYRFSYQLKPLGCELLLK